MCNKSDYDVVNSTELRAVGFKMKVSDKPRAPKAAQDTLAAAHSLFSRVILTGSLSSNDLLHALVDSVPQQEQTGRSREGGRSGIR